MIDALANEIIKDLNTDQDTNISWDEFKFFMDKTLDK